MNRLLNSKFNTADKRAALLCGLFVFVFVLLTLTQDLVRSNLRNSAFYFSESFMFTSFWWLFAPFFFAQYFIANHKNNSSFILRAAVIILPVILHLFAFPLLVWLLSRTFYYHTFAIQQTFKYTLSEYLYLLIALYTVSFLAFQYLSAKTKKNIVIAEEKCEDHSKQFIKTILVSEGYKKLNIAVSDIYYCSANPPYINIHLTSQKYLHNETLKSLTLKLNPEDFVRVHKSAIVNINMVASYKTRLNGDYDLTLKNDVQLRISRNYASDFKDHFNKTHQLAAK